MQADVGAPKGLAYWLSRTCIAARETAGVSQVHVARLAGWGTKHRSRVSNFEKNAIWPQDVEVLVAAYAATVGQPGFYLWFQTIQAWKDHGAEPELSDKEDVLDQLERRFRAFGEPPSGAAEPSEETSAERAPRARGSRGE